MSDASTPIQQHPNLRDTIAIACLPAIIETMDGYELVPEAMAIRAYEFADAMLKQRGVASAPPSRYGKKKY